MARKPRLRLASGPNLTASQQQLLDTMYQRGPAEKLFEESSKDYTVLEEHGLIRSHYHQCLYMTLWYATLKGQEHLQGLPVTPPDDTAQVSHD